MTTINHNYFYGDQAAPINNTEKKTSKHAKVNYLTSN